MKPFPGSRRATARAVQNPGRRPSVRHSISVAIDLAKSILQRKGSEAGSILLVSDLETAPDDGPALARTVANDEAGIRLRIEHGVPSAMRTLFAYLEAMRCGFATGPDADRPRRRLGRVELQTKVLILGALVF